MSTGGSVSAPYSYRFPEFALVEQVLRDNVIS